MSTDNQELELLIRLIEDKGGIVTVTYEPNDEGRKLFGTIQISGIKGIGPYPMAPIAAAERMRAVLAIEELFDKGNQDG